MRAWESVTLLVPTVGLIILACVPVATPIVPPTPMPSPTALPSPTPTPTPLLPPVGDEPALRRIEDLAYWPDEYKLYVDEDVLVGISFPSANRDWVFPALIWHLPSDSAVVLDMSGAATSRHYQNDEGRARLEQVLADAQLMEQVRERIQALFGPEQIPQDRPVLQAWYTPAVGSGAAADLVPRVTMWGDGRVVFVAPDGVIREGQVDAARVAAFVEEASSHMYLGPQTYSDIAGYGSTGLILSAETSQGRRSLVVLGFYLPRAVPGERHPQWFEQLRGLYRAILAAVPHDAPPLQPEEVVVLATPVRSEIGGNSAGDWPMGLVGRLSGERAKEATRLLLPGPSALYLLDGRLHQVTVKPVLPLLHRPGTEWPKGGLPRHPSVTAYGADGEVYRSRDVPMGVIEAWYRKAMPTEGWRLAKAVEDLQVWLRGAYYNDPIVFLKFGRDEFRVELLGLEEGVPPYPGGVVGACGPGWCQRVEGASGGEVSAWYQEYMAYMGWNEVAADTYTRDGRTLRLEYREVEGALEVSRVWGSTPPSGIFPLWPTPTPLPQWVPLEGLALALRADRVEGRSLAVRFVAELGGNEGEVVDIGCRVERWEFGDGRDLEFWPLCSDQKREVQIPHHFETVYTYGSAGAYRATFSYGSLKSEPVEVVVP